MLDTGLRHVELDDIRRQSKAEHISAIRSVISGDVSGAMRTLSKHTKEISDESERMSAIVDQWSKLENRDAALVITSRQDTKNALNDRMRDVLRQEGKLQDERSTEQLAPVFSSRADLKLASTYTVGDMVRFNRDAKSIGVKNGEYWRVVETDTKTNTVRIENGRKVSEWDPRKVGTGLQKSAQLFRTRESTISSGETIVWSRNNADLGLRNGQRLTVTSCDEKTMSVKAEDGRQVELDLARRDHCHWEHGYASTIYKSQGKTSQNVLVHAPTEDRNLLSQKAFLVAVSRQKDDITLFTDDKEKLERNIKENVGDKTSAIEGREEQETQTARKKETTPEITPDRTPSPPVEEIPTDQISPHNQDPPPLETYQDIPLETDHGPPPGQDEWSSFFPPVETYKDIAIEQDSGR